MRTLLGGLAVSAALLAIYGPHIAQATFVYEDDRMLAADGRETWVDVITHGRGLTNQSWQTIRTPLASHALNLALHVGTVLLAGILFWHITGTSWIGVGVASIVALHPIVIESVAYATSRAELLAALGALSALVLVLVRVRGVWLLAPIALLIAYAGKETGLVAVALIPLVLWGAGRVRAATDACWVIGVALAVTSAIWLPQMPRILTIGHMPNAMIDPISWALMQATAVWRLVVLSVWPAWLSVTPDIQPSLWLGLASLVLLAGLLETAWRLRYTAPLFTVGVLWCAIVAAPRFLVRTPLSPFNEHQWYLAMPGVACALIGLLEAACGRVEQWLEARCQA